MDLDRARVSQPVRATLIPAEDNPGRRQTAPEQTMNRLPIVPDAMRAVPETRGYLPGLLAGGFVFVAGQVGRTPDFRVIEDPAAQFAACFENLRLVLAAAGCGFDDIVELTTFHVDMALHWPVFREVKNRYVPHARFPITAVGVTELAVPGLLLEVKAIALAPAGEGS